ncbi:MAG: hypothetical protein IT363_01210 [Methanoregulaceae archaeon]|nr:hypothetical protein [Methanoregulaceae archaeon]
MNRSFFLALAATTVAGGIFYGQGASVNLQPTTPGTQQIGHSNISGRMIAGSVQAADANPTAQVIVGNATSTTGANFGGFFRSDSVLGRALYGRASAPSGTTHGVWGQSDSPAGRGVTGVAPATSGNATGVWGQTASTTGRGVYGFATATGGSNYGVYGQSSSPGGFGVYSHGNFHATGYISGNGTGLTNLNASALALGTVNSNRLPVPMELIGSVIGDAILSVTNTGSVASYGVKVSHNVGTGLFVETTFGKGVFGRGGTGGDFLGTGTSGYGVIGFVNSPTGPTVGALGETVSTSGVGVYASSVADTGTSYALRAVSQSSGGYAGYFAGKGPDAVFINNGGSGRGLRVLSSTDTGIWATTASGFAGIDGRSGSTSGLAVFGQNDAADGKAVVGQASGYGVYSFGPLGATGTKSFRIDHPLDPENRYLLHYSTESPTPQNFYSGNVKTNAQGKAWVELPSYFAEINANFKYQLTVVDDNESDTFVHVKVGRKIARNRFLIMSSEPNVEVSWRVEADRNDLWVRKNGANTEVDKQPNERGLYQHPELYGLRKEYGINESRKTGQKQRQRSEPFNPTLRSK